MRRQRPGIRQQQMLDLMWRHGGIYPPQWRLLHDKRRMLERMREMGLVVLVQHSSGKQVYRIAGTA